MGTLSAGSALQGHNRSSCGATVAARARPPTARSSRRSYTQIGQYILGQELGRGAFATVRVARHQLTNERVAVKVIDLAKHNAKSRQILASEARVMNLLEHPNIIRLFQVIDTVRRVYLVMEYATAGTFETILRLKGRLSDNDAMAAFVQIAAGVE